eukprot:5493035-Amphidinium_carterae.2
MTECGPLRGQSFIIFGAYPGAKTHGSTMLPCPVIACANRATTQHSIASDLTHLRHFPQV